MPRNSVMIPIQADALRSAVQKRRSLASLEESLGVTRQAINGWLSGHRIPPRKLSMIAEQLDFSTEELEQITTRRKVYSVLFRTHLNTPVSDESRELAISIAKDFFALDALREFSQKRSVIQFVSSDPSEVAEAILKQLDIQRERLSLDVLLHALEQINIHVLFVDFAQKQLAQEVVVSEKVKKHDKAFCVQEAEKYVIVIDSSQKLDDVMFNIFHELAHIFLGHLQSDRAKTSGAETKEQERFCTAVAVQVMTPDSFFRERKKQLKTRFECSYPSLPYLVDDLAAELNSSFVGVVYALGDKKHKIISDSQKGYLIKVDRYRDTLRSTVGDFIIPKAGQSLGDFWNHAFNSKEHEKFTKLQRLVKRALIEERISISRAAELFDIGEVEMQHLAVQWRQEYASIEAAN